MFLHARVSTKTVCYEGPRDTSIHYSIIYILLNDIFLVELDVKSTFMCFLTSFISFAMGGSETKYFHGWLFDFVHNSHELKV